ncbi:MAG: serine hydrolase [Parvularculaceae bacterium]|nr:serine hydrolase [Parvularculaceae bacterium]
MKLSPLVAAAGLIVLALGGYGLQRTDAMARIAAAYKAKTFCSEVFLAGRDPVDIASVEFAGISPFIDRAAAHVDRKKKEARASLFGLGKARAFYREGYGCTIASGVPEELPPPPRVADVPWPEALESPNLLRRVDYAELDNALDAAFADASAGHRAVVLIVDGRLVAERYAPGFSADTPMLSWSMAKSVTATLVGAAALAGHLNVEDPAPVPEWKDDPERSKITWNDLLRMQTGLEFSEEYGDPTSDVSHMLFRASDAGLVAAEKKLAAAPGDVWAYSSGTTNLLIRTLRQVLAERGVELQTFAREKIFAPIGAASFTLEPDSAGTPVGSSYVYATARDWAKLGELYLRGGEWAGARLLPENWSRYASTPTRASGGQYGAHFWLNLDGAGRKRFVPGLPESVYYMAGHEGQYVFIMPEKNAVIVRLGMTRGAVPIEVAGPVAARLAGAIGDLPLAEAADE